MSAYLYRVSKERCKQGCEMGLAAFLGDADDACLVMGGRVVGLPLVDIV